MNYILYFDIICVLFFVADGSHFLGGTITWRPVNESATGTPVAILVTQTYSWTYSLMTCTSAMIASNQFVPSYAGLSSNELDCISNCGSGSTGYSNIDVIPRCTDFSAPVGTTVGQRTDIVYLAVGDDFSVAFQDSAWRPLATASSAGWSISTRINTKRRTDNGLYNNAPVATMMSPINIPVNIPTVIHVPIADADGDTLRCRWSTSSNGVNECGGVCPPSSLPPNTVIYPNCTIIITGQHVGNWFGVTLMVEDFINSTSTTPLSSVPVQFLVQVVSSPSCTTPPEIIGILPEQSCTSMIVGQTFTSQIIAINKCGPSVTIDDIATLSFSGMVKSNIIKLNSTMYYKTITWTPTTDQLGYQVMCAMAFDSQDAQSAQYCFKFYVSKTGVCSCPGDPCITTTSTTSTTSTTTTATTSTSTTSTTSTSTTTSSSTSTTTTATTSTSTTSTTSTSTTSTTSTSTTSTTSTTTTSTTTTTTTSSTTSTTSTSTSTTSTTSTSSTSTTSTSTSTTTATTTTQQPDPINWPLIGSIIGLFCLAALTLCCCLCWRYLCLLGARKYACEQADIELYHIEQCTDSNCQWSDTLNSSGFFSIPRKNYQIYSALNESTGSFSTGHTVLLNSSVDIKDGLIEEMNGSKMIDFQSDSFLSMNEDRVRGKSISSISVTKVGFVDGMHTIENLGIKAPDRISNEKTNNSPVVKPRNSGSVRVSRMKTAAKQRIYSVNTYAQNEDTVKTIKDTRSRHQSADGVSVVRVTSVCPKSPMGSIRQLSTESLHQVQNTKNTRLDVIDEIKEPTCSSATTKRDKVKVIHVSSAHKQHESNEHHSSKVHPTDLSSNEPSLKMSAKTRDGSTRSVRVEHVEAAGGKNTNSENNTIPSASTVEMEQKKTKHSKRAKTSVVSGVSVERVPRENTAKSISKP